MTRDLARLDAVEAVAAMKSGAITPRAYAEAVAERAVEHEHLNSLQHFDPDQLVRAAIRAFEKNSAGALAGLPIVAKDNINTASMPTTGCTKALLGHTPAKDAGVIEKVASEGGYVGGKAGMHELAFGITSNNAVTGPVRNPVDPSLIAGGSSGGTAASIAAGIFPAGLGTDTGGSNRIPAALCGIVGFRPTTGRYDGDGVIPISRTRDTVGPMARSVRDIVLLDAVLAEESNARPESRDIGSITLGIPRKTFYDGLDRTTEGVVEAQLGKLASAGVRLVDIDLETVWPHNEAFGFPVVFYETARDLPAYLSEHAPGVSFESLVAGIGSPDVAGVFAHLLGEGATSEEAYRAALDEHRPAMLRIYSKAFEDDELDAIAFPTTPLGARPVGDDQTVLLNGEQVPTFATYIRNTEFGSNIGAPGITLPCPDASELPVGIEFDAMPGGDRALLGLAGTIERALAA